MNAAIDAGYFKIFRTPPVPPAPPQYKITNKRTHLVFCNMKDKEQAVDFLLKMNIPFQGIIRKPVLTVAPSKYIKGYLDLYLPEHIAGTSFNYKPL